MKDWLPRCNKNKKKEVAAHSTDLKGSLALILTIFLRPGRRLWLAIKLAIAFFVFVFTSTSLLRIAFAALQKPCQGNFGKFRRSGKSRFGGSEKDMVLQARKFGFLFPK